MTRLQELFMRNLKLYRKRRDLSQEKLAEACGISINHLASIEMGRRFPSPDTFQAIADALEITPSILLADPEKQMDGADLQLLVEYNDFLSKELTSHLKRFIEERVK
jgi:transcriptional regulator with XRE-family HTH domain